MKHSLKTTSGELTFALEDAPRHYPELGPQITVFDGDFAVAGYCVSTLSSLKTGFCVTRGKYEKYRAVSAEDLRAILTEVVGILSAREPKTI